MTYDQIKKAVRQLRKLGGKPDAYWCHYCEAMEIMKDPHYNAESNTIYGLKLVYNVPLPDGCYGYIGEESDERKWPRYLLTGKTKRVQSAKKCSSATKSHGSTSAG